MIGHTYHKRQVTRTVLSMGNGQVHYRDAYLDGFQREAWAYVAIFTRWLDGAEPGPAQRCRIGRPSRKERS